MRSRRVGLAIAACTLTSSMIFAACGDTSFNGQTNDASVDASDDSRSDAVVASDGSADGAITVDAGRCPSLHGPTMIAAPPDAPKYCIDSTEVTRGQYQELIDAIKGGLAPPSDSNCAWNTQFTPAAACVPPAGDDGGSNFPVTCVDWCDADSFCKWAGKHLCGSFDGGSLTTSQASLPSISEWENACTANNTQHYPYGSMFASVCNTPQSSTAKDALATVASTAYAGCVGGYPGLFDMAGNASEWLDACDDDASDAASANCATIGTSFENAVLFPAGQCIDYNPMERAKQSNDFGFRCCSN